MKETTILYTLLIGLCLYMLWFSWKGQKEASKLIQQHNPNWKPNGRVWQILWSLFKYKG